MSNAEKNRLQATNEAATTAVVTTEQSASAVLSSPSATHATHTSGSASFADTQRYVVAVCTVPNEPDRRAA